MNVSYYYCIAGLCKVLHIHLILQLHCEVEVTNIAN